VTFAVIVRSIGPFGATREEGEEEEWRVTSGA
jgi:hypothetical protein